jgi:hypothetical protein
MLSLPNHNKRLTKILRETWRGKDLKWTSYDVVGRFLSLGRQLEKLLILSNSFGRE